MRKFYALLLREVRSYFHSPIAYIVLIFFLIVSGIDFYFQVSFMNQRQVQYTVQEAFFNSVFFWFAFVLIFPLITMRLFAEEFKLGTRNQIIAAVISFCAITLLFFLGLVQFILLDVSSETRDLLGYFSAIEHMGTFSRGVIDTRPIVLYVSMTIVMLTLTHQAFQSRKWRL